MSYVYYNSTDERPQIAADHDENITQADLIVFVYANVDEITRQDATEFLGEVFGQLTKRDQESIYLSTIEFVESEECEKECEDVDDQVFPRIGFYLELHLTTDENIEDYRYDHEFYENNQLTRSFYYEFKK